VVGLESFDFGEAVFDAFKVRSPNRLSLSPDALGIVSRIFGNRELGSTLRNFTPLGKSESNVIKRASHVVNSVAHEVGDPSLGFLRKIYARNKNGSPARLRICLTEPSLVRVDLLGGDLNLGIKSVKMSRSES
jgi:hypothetical protein